MEPAPRSAARSAARLLAVAAAALSLLPLGACTWLQGEFMTLDAPPPTADAGPASGVAAGH